MSRKVLILANVGNRDVEYKGEPVRPAREEGARLYEDYERVSEDIQLPIILPGIRYIESLSYRYPEIRERGKNAPRTGLFCTDQENEHHRENDTVGFARIMERKLPELFPNRQENEGLRLNQKNPVIVEKIRDNPARYDRMYRTYERFFASNAQIRDPEGWLCFVLASGGTPAMNAMLILHAVQHFGENCVQVYVPPGEEPLEMRVGKQIAETDARRRFNEALDELQFRAATRIAGDAFGGYREPACDYADYRLAFDFRQARDRGEKAIEMAEGSARDVLERHAEVSRRLERGASNRSDQALLIAELFYNLEVKYRCGEFVDALGRAFRLQEAISTWIVEEHTNIRTGKRKRLLPEQEAAVEAVPDLYGSLERYRTAEGNKLELGREINRVALLAITEHLSSAEADLPKERRDQARKAAEAAKSIEKLADLRNKTIIAHGFEGVSKDRLINEYGSETLIEDLRSSVGAALDWDLSKNPFFEISERLRF